MSSGLYSRVKTWALNELLKSTDINAEFDNVIANNGAQKLGGYSDTTAQMKITTTPGATGTESLALSVSDELARLRYVIKRILGSGATNWYDSAATDLTQINTSISAVSKLPKNRLVSGRVTGKNQPIVLVPTGSTNSVKIKCATTNLVVYIGGTQYTFSSDITVSGLSTASADTATAAAAGAQDGELNQTDITISAASSGVTALAGTGKLAIFKTSSSEYLFMKINSASTALNRGYRGYFFDSSDNSIGRNTITGASTLNLLKAAWIFLKSDGTAFAVYNQPIDSAAQPSSPATGDMWFNVTTEVWSQYNGSAFVAVSALPVGVCGVDASNCVVARTYDFFAAYSITNTAELEVRDAGGLLLGSKRNAVEISVAGSQYLFDESEFQIKSTQVDSGITFAVGTLYVYVKDTGVPVLSDQAPFDREHDLFGFYHPFAPWRALAKVTVNATPAFTVVVNYLEGSQYRIGELALLFRRRQVRAALTTGGSGDVAVSANISSFAISGGTALTDVTGLTCTITTNGSPIRISLEGDGSSTESGMVMDIASAELWDHSINIVNTTTGAVVANWRWRFAADAGLHPFEEAVSLQCHDNQPAGTYAYKVQASQVNALGTLTLKRLRLVVCEE